MAYPVLVRRRNRGQNSDTARLQGMAQQPNPLTVAELVRRAVAITDPDDEDADLGDFEVALEDDDEPVTAVENLEERLAIAEEGADVLLEKPAVMMATAVALYLGYRPDEVRGDPEHVLRLAARSEWKGHPPDAVGDWLSARGVNV
jgi:hypothetical protein